MQTGLVLAAADAAAQLVQLREPVPLRALDQHHRRVGDVDAHLDHRGRHQHVGLPGDEAVHRRRLRLRAHLAVQQLDPEVAQLAGGQPLRLGLGGASLGASSIR